MPALGDEFRAAREARHLSLSDVSEQIHIRSVYLASIEAEDWGAIAAPVYVRGFLRTYARFLGLDGEDAVRHYNAQIDDDAPPVRGVRRAPAAARTGPSPLLWLAALVALGLVVYVSWSYYQYRSEVQPAAVATAEPAAETSPTASALPTGSAAPVVAGAGTLTLRTTRDTWLRVEVDGVQRSESIWPSGTERTYHGKQVYVRAGNAAGVEVSLNGKELGPMGASGAVVERTYGLTTDTKE